MNNIRVQGVVYSGNRVLILKRNEDDGGFWQTVTGTPNESEALTTTLSREIFEETGITDIQEPEILTYFNWYKNDMLIHEIVFAVSTKDIGVKLSEEHTAFKWCGVDTAIKMVGKDNIKDVLNLWKSKYLQ